MRPIDVKGSLEIKGKQQVIAVGLPQEEPGVHCLSERVEVGIQCAVSSDHVAGRN